jgi:hypothetical protein
MDTDEWDETKSKGSKNQSPKKRMQLRMKWVTNGTFISFSAQSSHPCSFVFIRGCSSANRQIARSQNRQISIARAVRISATTPPAGLMHMRGRADGRAADCEGAVHARKLSAFAFGIGDGLVGISHRPQQLDQLAIGFASVFVDWHGGIVDLDSAIWRFGDLVKW